MSAEEQQQQHELDAKRAEDKAAVGAALAEADADGSAAAEHVDNGQKEPSEAAPAAKPHLDCVDGCRFALLLPIVVAQFARFGTGSRILLKLLTQENVLVGGFFVILGYISGYAYTRTGERKAEEDKLANPELFFWQRVMRYYPLHFLVSAAFAPMFIWIDRVYRTPWRIIGFRAFLNFTLLQAWFPKEAATWNQPTWFLSSLTFVDLTMPSFILPKVASLSKDGLRKLFSTLTLLSVLQKVAYSETSRFHSREIATTKPMYPLLWNLTRFHPFWALVEMTMGVVAVRDVMLDTEEERRRRMPKPGLYLAASFGSLLLRLTWLDFNDAIIRGIVFVPLFTKFLTELHRDQISGHPGPLTRVMGSKTMAGLGALAFPMFLVHGPLGQVFYKQVVAWRLWGKRMPHAFFPVYLLLVVLISHLLTVCVNNRWAQRPLGPIAQWLADHTKGMLRDDA